MKFKRLCVFSCFLVGFVAAQDFRANLTGMVMDPSGAAVPNAAVKAVNNQTNTTKEVTTTSLGVYTIPYLDPGTYRVEVVAPGFQTLIREGIVLRVADKVNLPLQLAVGQTNETVTVTASQQVIETASADRGLVFDPIKTQQYPLNGRQTYMLMSLTPGVIFTQESFGPSGFSGTRGWDVNNKYKINGAREGQNLFLLNGSPISDKDGNWQLAPNVEAVQEFKVMTNTYDASYGRFGGGVVNTTIKGGGNAWHGDVFDYFRNTVLDANRTENKQTNKVRPPHNQHQFGGVVGGPIRKDKDFVFGSFEGWREVQPASVISSVPAPGLIDGQHFTQYGYTIYDPMTSKPCGPPTNCRNSAYIRDPFPGNVIPASRINPVGQKVLSFYPQANAPDPRALSSNYYTNTNGRYRYDQPMGRWDHNFNENNKLYALVTFQHGKEYRNSTGFAPPAGSGDINSQRTDQNYIASWNRVLSPRTVLDVRGSFSRFTSAFPRMTDYDFTIDKLGMNQQPHAPTVTKSSVPRFDVNGLTNLFMGGSSGEWNTYNQWNFTPSLMFTRGKHSIRTGFDYNYVMQGIGNVGYANGYFNFTRDWTRQLSGFDGGTFDGSSVASLLLGYPQDARVEWNDNPYRTRPYLGFYIQDDWKVARTLTLNVGLRYEIQVPWLERFNRSNRGWAFGVKNPYSDEVLANWAKIKAQEDAKNPKYPFPAVPAMLTGGFKFAGVNGEPSRLYDTDFSNIAPRIGIAWQVHRTTVIRTGAGVYYMSPTQNDTTTGFALTTNYITSLNGITPSAGTNLSGPYSLVNPYPEGILPPTGSSLGLATQIGRGVSFDPPRFKIPRTYQYSFGIQQQLPWQIVAEASYAGNYQIYINLGTAINEINLADYNQSRVDNSNYNALQVPNPFYGILPANGGQGQNPTISRGSLLRPDPVFQGITDNLTQWGRYRSDALQVKVEKRVLGGEKSGVMTWVLSYTFAKAFEQNHRLQNWNLSEPLIYELDNTDKPHSLSFSGVWDLPFGRGRKYLSSSNRVVNQLASGWQMDWVYSYFSGYPTGWPDLVNSCGDWHAQNQDRYHWFNNNKSCYSTRQSFTLRTVPDRFSDIRNPAQKQLNMAFEKTTYLGERYRFVIRGEAFNVTNTPNYGGPDTSFSSTRFGLLPDNQQNWPRLIQLSAKFFF